MLSGLLICANCGSKLAIGYSGKAAQTQKYIHYTCPSDKCDRHASNQRERFIVQITAYLERMIDGSDIEEVFTNDQHKILIEQIQLIESEVNKLRHQGRRLIQFQAQGTLAELYEEELQRLGTNLDALDEQYKLLLSQLKKYTINSQQRQSIEDLRAIGIEKLWSLPENEINQLLHSVMRNWRFNVLDKQIIGCVLP